MVWCEVGIHLICLCVFLPTLCLLFGSTEAKCIFDEIQPDPVPKTEVQYAGDSTSSTRRKRQSNPVYQPLRVTPYYMELDGRLGASGEEKLKTIIREAINKISKILSVIRVEGNLIIERAGCLTSWREGPNKGKCAQIEHNYKGEFCNHLIKLPDVHLSGLYTWDISNPEPAVKHIWPGPGVPDSDYILYIQSHSSTRCQNDAGGLIAYALHCRLDQNDRPVAGYVNFCPEILITNNFAHDKYYLTAIHELFHALGFSKQLFKKFRDCQGSVCEKRNTIIGSLGGVKRLITPAVVEKMQQHFRCPYEQDFGGPLEIENGVEGSHWHPRFLQGSIMSPTIEQGSLTFLDPISLAVFEDSGWYQVDYTQVDHYTWGKGEGCGFGQDNSCQTNTHYFCTASEHGCHYTHLTKGQCETSQLLSPCKIFKASKTENCSVSLVSPSDLLATGEMYGVNSRCFMANLTTAISENALQTFTGRCFQYMCPSVNVLLVKTSMTDWQNCPFGETINVLGYNGSLQCPLKGTLCSEMEFTTTQSMSGFSTTLQQGSVSITSQPSKLTQSSTATTTTTTSDLSAFPTTTYQEDHVVPVVVIFPSLNVDVLQAKNLVHGFVEAILMFVVHATDIAETRLKNVTLERGSVRVLFDIIPAQDSQEGPSSEETYSILLDCVQHGNWTVDLPSLGTHAATRISKRSLVFPVQDGKPAVSAGGIVGIVLGLVAILVLGAVISIILYRRKLCPGSGQLDVPKGNTSNQDLPVIYTNSDQSARVKPKCHFVRNFKNAISDSTT